MGEELKKVVRVIPPTKTQQEIAKEKYRQLRVVAYCRVSTKMEEQLNSYETQVKHYTEYIASKPDIITLDITMPVMDGIEALKQIKAVDSEAKVVMVSASSQKDKLIEAVKYGAEDFIAKPFEPSQIITVLYNSIVIFINLISSFKKNSIIYTFK